MQLDPKRRSASFVSVRALHTYQPLDKTIESKRATRSLRRIISVLRRFEGSTLRLNEGRAISEANPVPEQTRGQRKAPVPAWLILFSSLLTIGTLAAMLRRRKHVREQHLRGPGLLQLLRPAAHAQRPRRALRGQYRLRLGWGPSIWIGVMDTGLRDNCKVIVDLEFKTQVQF